MSDKKINAVTKLFLGGIALFGAVKLVKPLLPYKVILKWSYPRIFNNSLYSDNAFEGWGIYCITSKYQGKDSLLYIAHAAHDPVGYSAYTNPITRSCPSFSTCGVAIKCMKCTRHARPTPYLPQHHYLNGESNISHKGKSAYHRQKASHPSVRVKVQYPICMMPIRTVTTQNGESFIPRHPGR